MTAPGATSPAAAARGPGRRLPGLLGVPSAGTGESWSSPKSCLLQAGVVLFFFFFNKNPSAVQLK